MIRQWKARQNENNVGSPPESENGAARVRKMSEADADRPRVRETTVAHEDK